MTREYEYQIHLIDGETVTIDEADPKLSEYLTESVGTLRRTITIHTDWAVVDPKDLPMSEYEKECQRQGLPLVPTSDVPAVELIARIMYHLGNLVPHIDRGEQLLPTSPATYLELGGGGITGTPRARLSSNPAAGELVVKDVTNESCFTKRNTSIVKINCPDYPRKMDS